LKRGRRLACGSTSGRTTTINSMQLFQQQTRIFGSFGATMRHDTESFDF
jgi:alcohol dehydrogenase